MRRPGGSEIQQPGEYRVAVTRNSRDSRDPRANEVELVVLRGAADLVNEDGQTTLRAGERAFARAGTAPSYAYVYNSAAWDAFDRWSEARRAERNGGISAAVPARDRPTLFLDVRSLRLLAVRRVVRLRLVSDGQRRLATLLLRPLGELSRRSAGRGSAADAWAWPTHHYGRWGFSAGRGSGFPGVPGVRRGCPGRTRRAT